MDRSKSNSTKNFIKGAASLSLAALVVKILGVAYKIPLSHILGDDGMGYFNTAYTVYTFFFLICTAGVPKAITLLVTERTKEKNKSTGSLLKTAKFTFIIISIAIAVLFASLSFLIAGFIGNRRAAFAMLAIAPAIPFIAVVSIYRGYLDGYMRFGTVALSQFVEAALKLALGLAISAIGTHLNLSSEYIAAGAIFGITLGSIVTYIHLLIASKRLNVIENAGQNCEFNKALLKEIFKISLPITLSSGVMSLVNIIDLSVIIKGLERSGYTENLSTTLYGNYTTLAVPMFNFVLSVVSSICMSALPLLSELSISKKGNEFKNSIIYAAKIVSFFALPATIIFAFFSHEVLIILFDRGSVALGSALLAILSPSVALIALLMILNTALEAKGNYIIPLFSMSIGGIAKIIASTILLTNTNLAIWGAPIGTFISYVTSVSFSLVIYQRRIGRVYLLAKGFIKSAICGAIAVVPTIALRNYIGRGDISVFSAFLLLGLYGTIYLLLSLLIDNFPIKVRKTCQNRQ